MLPNIFPVACHTDNVGPGSTFVAIPGQKQDGGRFIPLALKKGARIIVVEKQAVIDEAVLDIIKDYGACLQRVNNARKALSSLSAEALGHPARDMQIIGITGTKGKTTTTFLLEHILRVSGDKTAFLGTLYNQIGDTVFPNQLTTPQPDYLHVFLDACRKAGVKWVIMEVAAQALSLHRVDDVQFCAAIFTNFSHEHGEFYQTQDDYFNAKARLSMLLKPGAPFLLNQHDRRVASLQDNMPHVLLFGKDRRRLQLCTGIFGEFNAFNCGAAAACAQALGISKEVIDAAFSTFTGVPGRMERHMLVSDATVIIDYAHNPSSFEAVLATLRPMTDDLLVVFGCGGDRDRVKRPIMGEIAAYYADTVFLTSDNPRSEDPDKILQDIYNGISYNLRSKVVLESNREQAIYRACDATHKSSIVALLGKGPDEYQAIGRVTYPFSERQLIQLYNKSCENHL